MKAKTFRNYLFLFLLIVLMAYLDSPYSILNKGYVYTKDQPASAQPVSIDKPTELPEIEERLEDVVRENGYIVETYQEYEVYRDQDGTITKEEPTDKTETLKYWDYTNETEKGSE